ncbi:MAG TPA: SurA N-terminal domain-containing protein [Chlamydiales bacterium]|nr:SurA N-terminal domain-containing protein [Chlamydiales bacterium]
MNKTFFLFLICAGALSAAMPNVDFSSESKIAVQNSILAKVNGRTISMIDVKKKMDLLFHQNYPQLVESNQARFQFYQLSWRRVLMEMIDHELMLADAVDKEVKLTDGEVREELERRFGPNVMLTLDKIGLTYDETWKMIKDELFVHRMSWWFVQSKAMQNITPQDIRQAYRLYLKENPPFQEWTYRVISIRADQADEKLSDELYQFLIQTNPQNQSPELLAEKLKQFETPTVSVQLSQEYVAADKDLSEVHRASLSPLNPGTYSKPSFQLSRVDKKTVYRIFYLVQKEDHPAPAFDTMSNELRNHLLEKAVAQQSQQYLEKLRKHYGFDPAHLKQAVPEDLHPFSLE